MSMTNLSRIDLNLLVVLEAIADEGGVSRAAEKLNLTQPAVSHALARLRQTLGDPLFVRDGRKLVPTALTRRLIEPLRRSLRTLAELVDRSEAFEPSRAEVTFTVSMQGPLEMLVLPRLMHRLAKAAPRIDLRIVQVRRRSVEAGLADGTLDAVFDVALPLSEHVHRQKVGGDRFVVVVRKGHPAIRNRLTLPMYLDQRHVMVTSRRRGPGAEDIELGQHGLHRRIQLRCRNYFSAFRVVGRTDLILTMPERYVALLGGDRALRVLGMPVKMPPLDFYLYWHDRVHADPANRWLRDQLLAAFEEG